MSDHRTIDRIIAALEAYLALHPDYLGQGLGKLITKQTLLLGFNSLGLSRIHLKVREWHERAIAVYEQVGFKRTGTFVAPIQGQPVHFVTMEIYPDSIRHECPGADNPS